MTAPRVSHRRAAAVTVAALTLAGTVVGALWALLAPPIRGVVALSRSGDRVRAYLGAEADHFFTAAFLLTGMLLALAAVAAVAVWQWRAHRGPVLAAALAAGCMTAAAAAAGVGAALVRLRYGSIDVDAAPINPENRVHYVVEAPAVFFGHTPLQIITFVLFPAGIAALVYGLCAVATSRDDLGGWPPVDYRPTGLTDRTATVDGALPVVPSPPSP
ncbi:hypothetical protein A5757_11295 [Mycobacterium sp. 852013-51886_SCH5428379]|uniref:DUF2567 domain-containing protein n=1 Tax=Mycobacterium sp. 852013-51886_SCH5428379 TaxID=1834111 RepID=UPI0007FC445D|nr:DUF2567 domain-containing protein [Mycobacterium sp. 852013-51886_SCH5428379]OBB59677.1 hypothetical protein A5757_11295 [Mycobacterium sp. 852013-51886_SCH5428379]